MARAWLVLAVLVVLSPVARAADADKAAEAVAAFESLYGADLKRVKDSRDPKDAVAFAAKLLAAAKQAPAQPELAAVLCDKAYELALAHPDGYATAVEAIRLEAAAAPEKAAACADRLVEVRQRQFDQAKGDARPSAGETLIDAVLAAVETRQKAGAPADEMASYKRAFMVARAVKSDRAGDLEAHVKALEQAVRLAVEIENLKKLIALEPKNQAARQRLVRLHLVDYDDPAEAAKLLEGVEDASLLKYVPAAAKPLETVPEFACLELGEWYRGLADAAPPAARPLMFVRAKAYCERFLQLHAAEDINRSKAALLLQKIVEGIQAAGTARPVATKQGSSPAAKTKKEEWIDLLALVDPQRDAVLGDWSREAGGLVMRGPGGSRLAIPCAVEGDYELKVEFARMKGDNEVAFILPVGSRCTALLISKEVGKRSGLFWAAKGDTMVSPAPLANHESHVLEVLVKTGGGTADMDVRLDGKPYFHWQGAVSSASLWDAYKLPSGNRLGLGAWGGEIAFKSARLRMLSGEARPLRAAEKPAGSTRTIIGPAAKAASVERWTDLLALADPAKDAVKGPWQRDGTSLVLAEPTVCGRIMFPRPLVGSYELQVKFLRRSGSNEIEILLPVGSTTAAVVLSHPSGGAHGLEQIKGMNASVNKTTVKSPVLENGREYTLEIQVGIEGDRARVSTALDGTRLISWEGPTSALAAMDGWRLPDPTCAGMGAGKCVIEIRGFRARSIQPAGAAK